MKQIKIKRRLRPYSKRPGVQWLIPGTTNSVTIFPTRLEFEGKTITLPVSAHTFKVFSDLDRGRLELYLPKKLTLEAKGGALYLEGGKLQLPVESALLSKTTLFLGSSKKQLCGQMGLAELIPLAMRLGSGLPEGEGEEGPFALLQEISLLAEKKAHDQIAPLLEKLFAIYFSDELFPHIEDFSGFGHPTAETGSPLDLLGSLSHLLERFFFEDRGDKIQILQTLLPQFPAGRYIGEEIAIRWSKKSLFSLEFRPKQSRRCTLITPHAKRARLCEGQSRTGRVIPLNEERLWEEGAHYTIDCLRS